MIALLGNGTLGPLLFGALTVAPFALRALHRQNRDEWCDDIERLRHGLEDA